MSLSSAMARGEAASLAPRALRSSTASRLRWARTVSGQPLSTMFFAMPWPMSPTPMKPIRSFMQPPIRVRLCAPSCPLWSNFSPPRTRMGATSGAWGQLRRSPAHQRRMHLRRDDGPEELDRAQDRLLRLCADRHLHQIALMAEDLVLSEDLRHRLVRRPDHQMPARAATCLELRPGERRPAALLADAAHHLGIGLEEGLDRGFGGVGEEAVAVDPEG